LRGGAGYGRRLHEVLLVRFFEVLKEGFSYADSK
jgi:hypothetical protein